MDKKKILEDLAQNLDFHLIKYKYQLTNQEIAALLQEAAQFFPEVEPKPKKETAPAQGEKSLLINIDGASRGNPGPAAYGIVVSNNKGEALYKKGRTLGRLTNNQAEYQALLAALKVALEMQAQEIYIKSDSELLVKQMLGEYKARNENILPLYQQAKKLSAQFKVFFIMHVPRAENALADSLANAALDGK